jgi:oligosaccharide translocation protein RFT1
LIPTLLTPAALLACAGFYAFSSPSTSAAPPPPQWSSTILLYSLSVLIELVSEPLYLETLAAWQTLTTKRVKVEGFAIFVKAVATLAAVRFVVPDESDALLAFGIGQLAYSLTIWIGLYRITRNLGSSSSPSWRMILPRRQTPSGRYFDQAILETGWALTKQSVIKQLLTEGDKLAVGKFGSEAEMGGYAVALNYGEGARGSSH